MTDAAQTCHTGDVRSAEVVVSCADLAAMLAFCTGELGLRVELIYPADAPRTAVVSGHGVRLRLETATGDVRCDLRLRLTCGDNVFGELPRALTAPNGMRVEMVSAARSLEIPGDAVNREWVLTRGDESSVWVEGRAGMQYRDLVPSRLGGRFIASHIRIPDGGPVPDYVHYHKVRFQLIFCRRGWVRVVYEGQGEPFVLEAGDCVLQPPEIRHRVLESSAGLEVVEVGCPAVHETWADHELELPAPALEPERLFGGQRFVRHVAARARWEPSGLAGIESADTGIAAATGGLARVRVLRAGGSGRPEPAGGDGVASPEFHFLFVLAGSACVSGDGIGRHRLGAADGCVLPGGEGFALSAEPGAELLEVRL